MQKRGTWLRAGLTGAAAGAVNGLFGAGGGMLLLPLLHRLTDLREHEAFACSVCTMLPLSVVSLVVYWLRGGEFLTAALPYLAGGALGGPFQGEDVLSVQQNAALGGGFQHGQAAQQSGFAGAGHADDAENIPLFNGQAHVLQGRDLAGFVGLDFGKMFNLDHMLTSKPLRANKKRSRPLFPKDESADALRGTTHGSPFPRGKSLGSCGLSSDRKDYSLAL